jgi:hypothetical protein
VRRVGRDARGAQELQPAEREKGKQTRLWPLRVLRIKSAKYDSGWKVLPASDWDPNY